MNLKSGQIDKFVGFSQFTSLNDFNNHIEMWLVEHKHEFTKGGQVGLKRLVRFSAKIPGVCNAKIGTILKAINEEYNDNGISRSTFKRMILKAKELGILTVHEMERKNGSQSSNLYVFNRFPTNDPPKQEILNHPKETINLFKTNNQKQTKRIEEPLELDHSFTNDRVPKPFVQLVKYFFPEAKTIEEYWRMVQIAAYRNDREKRTHEVLETGIQSFKQLISTLKSNKSVKKPIAYFYGILDNKFEECFIEEFNEMALSLTS